MTAVETWKDIPDFEGLYQISTEGRIKRLGHYTTSGKFLSELILKPIEQKSGYFHIGLWRGSKRKQLRVHRLVAIVFLDNPENKTQVNHINEIKSDNRLCNLEWASPKENTNWGSAIERRASKKRKPIIRIDKFGNHKYYPSIIAANRELGLGYQASKIVACCKGKQKTAYGYNWQYA